MRLLLDQDVYAVTARFLSDLGHDVLPVGQIGLAVAKDRRSYVWLRSRAASS